MDKQNVAHIYNEIVLSLERKEILTHVATWTNLEEVMLCKMSEPQKEKCMILLTWGTYSSQIHGDRKKNGGCQNLCLIRMGFQFGKIKMSQSLIVMVVAQQ